MSQGTASRRAQAGASFRDPDGRLLLAEDRVLRLVSAKGAAGLRSFLSTNAAREFTAEGRLVGTRFLGSDARAALSRRGGGEAFGVEDGDGVLVEHERVAVRSFPYEWPPEMLHAAGALTLDLAERALDEGFTLKDATPYNVLFRGPRAVFVDLLSFERRDPHDPTWLPLNQFTRTTLLPLLVNKHFGLRLDQLLTSSRDGLEPSDVARMCGAARRLRPTFLSLVTLPHLLGAKQSSGGQSIYEPKRLADAEKAGFILRQQFRRLRRQLDKVEPGEGVSAWSSYMTPNRFHPTEYLRAKESFVAKALAEVAPRRVLDVGCNTGHFSALAARAGASVVAIDQDPAVVGALWRRASAEGLDVLPLVVNLARPTPATGWRNEENPSFLERARGGFDTLLMLAVLHHMHATEQIPLEAVFELAAELTSDSLVVEFVAPEDPLFRTLLRGREELFAGLTRETFERAASRHFQVVRAERLHETRWLYLMRGRGAVVDV
ncbi:MAG TPA: methyltransferase domain-containing protein [Pyrinomonadaceae bacterium]|nr:methyltransferase domain-containing protein [Pyrinomonadaceae bacterium]